jgi:Flp pilus assembly protein TadG
MIFVPSFRSKLRSLDGFIAEESAQTIVVAAICLMALIGFVGLAIDVGHLRYEQRRLQIAADSAALAAGLELQTCVTANTTNCSAMQKAAQTSIAENAYTDATLVANCGTMPGSGLGLMVNNPVCANGTSDPNHGNANYVEVVMKEYATTYFARLLGFSTVPISVRAEATRAPAPCIYALDPNGINAITVDALASLQATCPIVDESKSAYAFGCNVLASVSATMIRVTGGAEGLLCLGVNPPPETKAPVPTPADPLSYLNPPTFTPGVCTQSPLLGLTSIQILGKVTLNPGTYCGGLVIGPLANVTFNPGTYIFTSTGLLGIPLLGGMTVTAGATITGNGVTFYNYGPSNGLTGGITFAASALSNINLTAPTTGPYAGVLFYQDRANTAPAILAANLLTNNTLQGAFYFPSASVSYAVNGGNAKFNILVAKDIDFAVITLGSTAYEQSVFGNNYSSLPGGVSITPTGAVLTQ